MRTRMKPGSCVYSWISAGVHTALIGDISRAVAGLIFSPQRCVISLIKGSSSSPHTAQNLGQ